MNIKINVSANPDKMTQTQNHVIKRVAQVLILHEFEVDIEWGGKPAKAKEVYRRQTSTKY